ncbi:MAG: hypothetical protein ACLUB3_11815 [Clostridium sp.]
MLQDKWIEFVAELRPHRRDWLMEKVYDLERYTRIREIKVR